MPNLALFDFDNTITVNDNFTPFVYYAVSRQRMLIGKFVLSPLLVAYKVGILSASAMRASVVRLGFYGRSEADIRRLGLNYSRHKIPSFIRPHASERIRWHKDQGDVVAVVSASLDVYLSDWCLQHGLDLICTELESRNGKLTGRYLSGDCTGPEKARRVREKYDLQKYPVIYAYGDSYEDQGMLGLAHKRYYRWREQV